MIIKRARSVSLFLAFALLPAVAPEHPAAQLAAVLDAARQASGARARLPWEGFTYVGRSVQGGSAGRVWGVVRFSDGWSRMTFVTGPLTQRQGFNGESWVANNGIVGIVDLPGLARDAVTQAYLAAQGWLVASDDVPKRYAGRVVANGHEYDVVAVTPPHGSTASLWFDAETHLLSRTVLQSDGGPDVIDYADFRDVEGVVWPFSTTEREPTGGVTQTNLFRIRLQTHVDSAALALPPTAHSGRSAGTVTIPMRSDARTYMGHIVLTLRVGRRALMVLFDSGGQNTLTPGALHALRIPTAGSVDVGGSGEGSETASVADAGTISLGAASLLDQRFIVFPLPYEIVHPSREVNVAGIVGAEFLQNFRVTIDYAAHRMSLSPFNAPERAAGRVVPFLSDGAHAYVWASIDGFRGLFSLDTGDSSGVTIFGPFARRHHLYESGGVRYIGLGIGGGDAEDEYRGTRFSIAGVTLSRPVVRVARTSSGDFASRSVAGNVGADVLSRFTLTFDYHARTVTFEPNATVYRRFREDMTGLTVVQVVPASFHVISVATRSPAAVAGIRVGDDIVAVDGVPVRGMGVKDFDGYRFGGKAFSLELRSAGVTRRAKIEPRLLLP